VLLCSVFANLVTNRKPDQATFNPAYNIMCMPFYASIFVPFPVCDNGNSLLHGPLIPLDESRGWDQDSKSFTSVPVPLQVTVKMSSIMNAGKGVFAKEFIPQRTRIGPYKGEVIQKEDVTDKTDMSYFWEVNFMSNAVWVIIMCYF